MWYSVNDVISLLLLLLLVTQLLPTRFAVGPWVHLLLSVSVVHSWSAVEILHKQSPSWGLACPSFKSLPFSTTSTYWYSGHLAALSRRWVRKDCQCLRSLFVTVYWRKNLHCPICDQSLWKLLLKSETWGQYTSLSLTSYIYIIDFIFFWKNMALIIWAMRAYEKVTWTIPAFTCVSPTLLRVAFTRMCLHGGSNKHEKVPS